MPISHKYNTLFVHITKTAGSSLEAMLEIDESNDTARRDNLINYENHVITPQHFVPRDIQAIIGAEGFARLFKFTVVRNPFDRMVSAYHFITPRLPPNTASSSFEEFLRKAIIIERENMYDGFSFFHHYRPQHHYFDDIQYDFIARFETLESDIAKLKELIHCPNVLPMHNVQSYERKHAWTRNELYLFDKVYRKDVELLGYTFVSSQKVPCVNYFTSLL